MISAGWLAEQQATSITTRTLSFVTDKINNAVLYVYHAMACVYLRVCVFARVCLRKSVRVKVQCLASDLMRALCRQKLGGKMGA